MAKFTTYAQVGLIAARQTLASRVAIFGRVTLFSLILLIFSRLWRVAFSVENDLGLSAADLTWYMAATEWIALAIPMLHLEIERDVRNGDLATQLPRPISYLGAQIAKGLGIAAIYLGALIIFGTPITWALAGSGPSSPWALLLVVPLAIVATALAVVVSAIIGLGAFWITDASPLHWVWQKLLFILGGLILPLTFYPTVMQTFGRLSPFGAILNGPANLMLIPDGAAFFEATLRLAVWSTLLVAFATWLYRRALALVDVNGG